MTAACTGCGGRGGSDQCRELFDQLLALEFTRVEPWGPLHGLTVATYALQHPDRFPAADHDGWLTSLHVYTTHGQESAERMWAAAPGRGLPVIAVAQPSPAPSASAFSVTIFDVAGPGQDFPADGHHSRVDHWARATYAELMNAPA